MQLVSGIRQVTKYLFLYLLCAINLFMHHLVDLIRT
jgi:hypothetical protein